ncbi:MAG: tRNA (adenosine(37)-N6)-threonylcarbamoyltransferase complex dimerization subunit type 1 TsaB [Erysipelotrichaceae bacterium]
MKTLCIDTSHTHLVLVLIENDNIVASFSAEAWKKQSETVFPEMIKLMDEAKWNVDDINQVVVSVGPGSYTGVRIGMCIAKVLCTTKNIPLYTIDTLALYAGKLPNVLVMNDARSLRAYVGVYNDGKAIEPMGIWTLDQIKTYIKEHNVQIIGNPELIDLPSVETNFIKNFLDIKDKWKLVENVHTLVPLYLKEQEAYKVK